MTRLLLLWHKCSSSKCNMRRLRPKLKLQQKQRRCSSKTTTRKATRNNTRLMAFLMIQTIRTRKLVGSNGSVLWKDTNSSAKSTTTLSEILSIYKVCKRSSPRKNLKVAFAWSCHHNSPTMTTWTMRLSSSSIKRHLICTVCCIRVTSCRLAGWLKFTRSSWVVSLVHAQEHCAIARRCCQ